jgi:23S rRNA pseudouridine1911/1915/1917 synthase
MKLRGGETVEIIRLLELTDNLVKPTPGTALNCVFEDSELLAFDKSAGMPVQPLDCEETGTLMNAVVAAYPECRNIGDTPLMAGALHRIDAGTSGLVLVARSDAAFGKLRRQFSEHSVKKTYLALVEGAVATGGTLENDLVHDPTLPFCRMIDFKRNRLTRAQCEGLRPMHAVTRFTPIGRTMQENEERTLLEVTIYTGVTHQIRAQLALAGMHIVNDRLYGAFAVENQTGHCLHSLSASFRHPTFCTETEIRTNYPDWAIL